MPETRGAGTTRPPTSEDTQVEARWYDHATGRNVLERKSNPFMRSAQGGRVLSALMYPLFAARPPSGFGVITTTGRRTGKMRRKCIHVIRRGDRAYIVMLRPVIDARPAAWLLNIRANPNVRLRIPGGTFTGIAREVGEAEMRQARETYCETVNLFDFVECAFHRSGRPTRSKIKELHSSWFDTGIPLVVELGP